MLTPQQKSMLALLKRSAGEDGWANVSAVVMPLVIGFELPELIELEMVSWVDSRQADGKWRFVEDVPEPCVVNCRTVGWVVSETPLAIMIAQSLGDHDSETPQCAGVKQIPKCSIVGRQILKTRKREAV